MLRTRGAGPAKLAESQLAFGWGTIGERLTTNRPYAWAETDTVLVIRCRRGAQLTTAVSTSRLPSTFTDPLESVDPEIAAVLRNELGRQRDYLEMIASENFVPRAVLEAQGSVLTNKYAEGYPGRRYYGGCEYVDVAEQLAIDRAKSAKTPPPVAPTPLR